jgi:hypothetical protein
MQLDYFLREIARRCLTAIINMNFMHSVPILLRTDEPDSSILVAEFCERRHLLIIKCVEYGFLSLKEFIYADVRPLVQLGLREDGVLDVLQFVPG